MKTIILLLKVVGLVSSLGAYAEMLPPKLAPVGLLVFATASTVKDLLVKVGDWLDNKQIDGSFKG